MPRNNELTTDQANDLARHLLGPGWRAYRTPADECGLVGSPNSSKQWRFLADTWRAVFRSAGVKWPARPQFVAIKDRVMLKGECVAVACSITFARRAANALNEYEPDQRGV